MSESFKYRVGDILENGGGRIVKVVSIIGGGVPYPYVAEPPDEPDYRDSYAEHELTWPSVSPLKVGQLVEVINDNVSELDIVGDRGVITYIDDPVIDSLSVLVMLESGDEWYLSPAELKVIEKIEEGEDEERQKFMSNWENGTFCVQLRTDCEAAKVLFATLGSVVSVNAERKSLADLLDGLLHFFPNPDEMFDEAIRDHEVHFLNGAFYVDEPCEGFEISRDIDPDGKENELAFYRQEVERLEREVKAAQFALKRSTKKHLDLSYTANAIEYACLDIAEKIASLREEQRKSSEDFSREENASE